MSNRLPIGEAPPIYADLSSPERAAAGSLASAILAALKGETASADEISERLAAPHADVLTELVELELSGHVVRGAGALYRLA